MADPIEITMDEIQVAINAPKNYAPFVLHKLFQLPYDMPMPEVFLFLEERQQGRPRTLIRNQDSLTIGIELYPTVDKASILTYITKASKSVVDVSVWKDVVVDPADNPVPPEPEPEPEEPSEPEAPEEPETPEEEPEVTDPEIAEENTEDPTPPEEDVIPDQTQEEPQDLSDENDVGDPDIIEEEQPS